MKDEKYGLIVFPGTTESLKAEKLLKQEGYSVSFRPLPPVITADCGFGLEIPLEKIREIREFIEQSPVQTAGFYHIIIKDGEKIITSLE